MYSVVIFLLLHITPSIVAAGTCSAVPPNCGSGTPKCGSTGWLCEPSYEKIIEGLTALENALKGTLPTGNAVKSWANPSGKNPGGGSALSTQSLNSLIGEVNRFISFYNGIMQEVKDSQITPDIKASVDVFINSGNYEKHTACRIGATVGGFSCQECCQTSPCYSGCSCNPPKYNTLPCSSN